MAVSENDPDLAYYFHFPGVAEDSWREQVTITEKGLTDALRNAYQFRATLEADPDRAKLGTLIAIDSQRQIVSWCLQRHPDRMADHRYFPMQRYSSV